MSAQDDAIAADVEALALTMRATVYTRAAGGGFDTSAKTSLKCSLDPVGDRSSAATNQQRTELAMAGRLEWEKSYSMPIPAQLVVDAYGTARWNVQAGTVWPDFGPDGGVISYRADVVRAT